MNTLVNCPDWMLNDPLTKAEYDRFMQIRIDLGDGFIGVYDVGFDPVKGRYYQLTADSPKVWLADSVQMAFWVPLDPRWERDMNRSPYRYRDEYRGEAETWGPVPWDAFQA